MESSFRALFGLQQQQKATSTDIREIGQFGKCPDLPGRRSEPEDFSASAGSSSADICCIKMPVKKRKIGATMAEVNTTTSTITDVEETLLPQPTRWTARDRQRCHLSTLLLVGCWFLSASSVEAFCSHTDHTFHSTLPACHRYVNPMTSSRPTTMTSFSFTTRLYTARSSVIPTDDNDDVTPKKINYNWTSSTFQIAVPALVAMLADPILSLVDTMYTGRVGSTELAALGACTSIFHLAFNSFRGFTSATTSLVATELSKAEKAGDTTTATAKQVTAISLWFAWWVGVAVSCTLYLTGNRALASMGVPGNSPLFSPAREYLYARLWAAPAVLLIGT